MTKLAPPGTLTALSSLFGDSKANMKPTRIKDNSPSHSYSHPIFLRHSLPFSTCHHLVIAPLNLFLMRNTMSCVCYPHPRYCRLAVFNSSLTAVRLFVIVTIPQPLLLFTQSHLRGSYFRYDSSSSFWNFLAAGNYAARFYRFAMTDVTAMQAKLQHDSFAVVAAADKAALALLATESYNAATASVTELLTKTTVEEAHRIVSSWRDLLPKLITKYVLQLTLCDQ